MTLCKLKITIIQLSKKEHETLRDKLLFNSICLINSVFELRESDSGLPDLNPLCCLRLNVPRPKVAGS